MTSPRSRRAPRPPLDPAKLSELAIFYVGRFATSRGRLLRYLERKVRERGWEGSDPSAQIVRVADRMVELGYIDDRAFAASRARSLEARGLGPRRLHADLSAAGIAEGDRDEASIDEMESAMAFARRKRIGPFANEQADRQLAERQLASMARAGHRLSLARQIIACAPGEDPRSNFR